MGERQPDLAVILARDYGDPLPIPEDVLLLIEVADTSLVSDREVKLPLYARSGIAEVWLVGYRLVRCAMPGDAPVATVLT